MCIFLCFVDRAIEHVFSTTIIPIRMTKCLLYKYGGKIYTLFCAPISEIVFMIIITYILYICRFINIIVFLIVIVMMIMIMMIMIMMMMIIIIIITIITKDR